ncbi:MAG: methyl-accepting chemotaxis protein [Deltaproteobacteria bacterium]|nr:methyl-accepting chemotaxis protein [Deltaproteobacteria bacterium]
MGRTSIKNKLILSFLALLLIVMVVVGVVNRITNDFYLAQAISSALAMASGVIFGSVFSRSLVRRLNNLSNVAREISQGDLSREIPLLSQDEVRNLEEIFALMVSHLRGMLSEMKNASQQVQETNENLIKLAKKVLENSHKIDQSATAIAKGSEEQTLIVQKTSLKVDDGLKEMDEIVKQSADIVSKINEARHKTETGEINARETLNHLQEVLKQMVEYTKPIYRLSNKVEKIQLVIKVMDEIAQKTDLLSLNASIEATRAGEMGKGFALVANEIRSMAENSKQSSQEIETIVQGILEDNKAVIETLSKSQAGINKGREIIHGIVDTFGEMLSGVKDIFLKVQEMEEVTEKQARQMRGLLSYFQDLSRLAQENFVSTQKTTIATKSQEKDMKEIVNAMQSLNALSEKMMETQQRFRLGAS